MKNSVQQLAKGGLGIPVPPAQAILQPLRLAPAKPVCGGATPGQQVQPPWGNTLKC